MGLHRNLLLSVLLIWASQLQATDLRVVALFNNKVMVELEGKRVMLEAGKPVDGIELVSSDFEAAVFRIDGKEQTLGLSDRVSSSYTRHRAMEVRIPQRNGSYQTRGEINGRSVELIVDTGATSVALSQATASRLGIDLKDARRSGMAETASGLVRSWLVLLDTVRVGEIEQRNVEAAVLSGAYPSKILLGMTFLQRVQMEHQGSVMVLRER
jgi:aspartyl protease family protein